MITMPQADLLTIPPFPAAVLFDMDGTLTAPFLDYPAIKAEMGIGNSPIIEGLAALPPSRRPAAEAILHRHEARAAEHSTLNPGCADLLAWLVRHHIPTALITRNSSLSMQTVVRKHSLPIKVLISRDDCVHKPDPTPLLLAMRRLGMEPRPDVWMVGDGPYDIEAAIAAGVVPAWISHGRVRPFEATPRVTVAGLPEVQALLESAKATVGR